MNLVIYASGYRSVFANDALEIASIGADTWSPQTQDFRAAATRSGLPLPAASFVDVIRQIGTQRAGSIDKLGIIAHSNSSMIALAGHIILTPGGDATFTPGSIIDASMLTSHAQQITTILDRFVANASIVLFSCNSGTDLSLLIQFQTGLHESFSNCPSGSA